MIHDSSKEMESLTSYDLDASSFGFEINPTLPQVRMEPLREAIGAHLCCGLSHIDPDIQRDALKVNRV